MANEAYELLEAKTGEELQQDLLEAKTRLQKLRFANAISPIQYPNSLKKHLKERNDLKKDN